MVTNDEGGFAVHDKPEIMFNAGDFHDRFVRMPFVGIQVEHGEQPDSHIVEQRSEGRTPVADRRVRNADIKGCPQNKADVTERAFAEIEHGKG